MASRYELEVKLISAKGLKNVNWRHGSNKPYAVVYVDPANKSTTNIDESGDVDANWDQTLKILLPAGPIEDKTLHIDIIHNGSEEGTKPLIGSAQFNLSEVIKDIGYGERLNKTLTLKRPSGRPQGKVEIKVSVIDKSYQQPGAYYNAPAYGVPQPRDYAPPAYGNPYGGGYNAPPAYGAAPPAYGAAYAAPPPQAAPQGSYGSSAPPAASHGSSAPPNTVVGDKKSKFGLGAGLAVGALAGGVGALALIGGADYVEDKIAEKVVEKLEDDYYDDDY
ncbi:hypothetical protein TanjilG_14998 [Lupinus angustifolius]|uniref:C2 domain-containing protein n=1 Tax=Lupinus angustifolius TaxID=3871 RepID=A0A4P1RAN7_LUPAN|nr:PREDICTED: uncharacterized protein LOC109353643 [Lupinus angustifolius]OIW06353.1 hypothetical protein TanjilG_14998 [Lupinus angustifolius]